jgi:DNA-binding winged helix-turn-helix (wHTH) protein/Tol biopolymer transport system component
MPADIPTGSFIDYYFGPYRFDGRLRRLYKDGELIVLTPKAADTLVALVERAGRVVEKEELLRVVWGDITVGDDTLAQNISTLRRVLADDANRPGFIATVPRRGYRFVAAVRAATAPAPGRVLEAPTPDAVPPVPAGAATQASGRFLAVIGIAAVTAAVAGFLAQQFSVNDRPRALIQFTVGEPESYRFSTSGGMLALSPDGQYLSFVAIDASGSTSLWLRPLGSTISRRLDGSEGAAQPFWSPDSRTIAFFAERRLKAIDVTSGVVRVIASLASPRSLGGTWSRTGQVLFSVPADGMYLVPASGGSPQRLAPAPEAQCEGCVAWPHFLPDGRRFLYTVAGSDAAAGIYVGQLGSSGGRRLLDAESSSTYVSPGLLSFARSGTLYVQQFDTDRLVLTGDPAPVSDSVAYNAKTGRVLAATSETGVLAFRKALTTELMWVDRAGKPQNVAAPPATYLGFAIAPDGRRVAAARVDPRAGTSDVWVFDQERELRVTDNPDWDGDPVWSEDGLNVVYSSRRGGRWSIYRRQATTVGPEELLLDSDSPVTPLQVLRSTQVVYAARRPTRPFDVWQLDRGKAAPLVRIGGFYPIDARLSPDERWLAYGMPETAGNVWEQPLYVSEPRFRKDRRMLAEAASMPRWRADGQELFYLSKDSSIVAIPIDPRRTPSDSAGRVLFRASGLAPTGLSGQVYDVTPDGQRFLLKREVGSSPIHVVLNWDAPVRR